MSLKASQTLNTGAMKEISQTEQALKKFDKDAFRESELFQINLSTLRDEHLENNVLFKKLKSRLEGFFLLMEKVRIEGESHFMKEQARKTGYSFAY